MKTLMSLLKKGIPLDEFHKNKISKKLKGRIFTESHKENLKISRKKQTPPTLGKKFTEEQKKRMSESCITKKHRVFKDTKIELKIEQELIKYRLNYKKQEPLCKIAIVDFYLPDYKIIIECDGDYWHNLPGRKERDNKKDIILKKNGYYVFRFTEKEINENSKQCISIVISFIKELTLHVHHKHYNKGAKIWEYENWELTTLCENCHNNKHNKIQPQTIIKLPHLFKFENGTQRVFDFDIYDDDEKNGLLDLLCLVKDNYDGDYLFKRLNEYFINEGFNEIDIILNKFSRLSYLEHIEGYYASKIQTLEKKINEL